MAATIKHRLAKIARVEREAKEWRRYGFITKRDIESTLAACRRARREIKEGGAR